MAYMEIEQDETLRLVGDRIMLPEARSASLSDLVCMAIDTFQTEKVNLYIDGRLMWAVGKNDVGHSFHIALLEMLDSAGLLFNDDGEMKVHIKLVAVKEDGSAQE